MLAYIRFEAVPSEELVRRVGVLVERFRANGILIDQRPDGELARALYREHRGITFLQRFSSSEGEKAKMQVNALYRVLSFDREETLGAWCDLVRRGPRHVTFPKSADGVPFTESAPARHILTGACRIEAREGNGLTVHRFRSGSVENHWFMASVFAWRIAEHQRGRRVRVDEIRLVGERVTS